MRPDPFYRRGLRESLQQYARRLNLPINRVRATWRAQGLNAMADHALPLETWIPIVEKSWVRIAPGVGVPCGPAPEDVIENEPDEQPSATARAYTRARGSITTWKKQGT